MQSTVDIFRNILIKNELDGNTALIYQFSDADGVRTGRSGWSFGVSQFDVQNNPHAILCLRDCDFTTDEIDALKRQEIDVVPLNGRLLLNKETVDLYDFNNFAAAINHVSSLCRYTRVFLENDTIYHLADYHNQFYMSREGKLHSHLKTFGSRRVKPVDILKFKLSTAWGKKRPDDVYRRYNNVVDTLKTSY